MDNPIDSDRTITVYDVAVKLKNKIEDYKGGGTYGVYKAIDPRFKRNLKPKGSDDPKIKKSSEDKTGITKDAFRQQVKRLDNKELKNVKMQLGLGKGKGNILLLLNVLEILEIKNLSDLLDEPVIKPNFEQITLDTNIRVKAAIRKLNKIYEKQQLASRNKPRFTANKASNDWFTVLNEIKNWLDPPKIEKSIDSIIESVLNPNAWIDSFVRRFDDLYSKFGIQFHTILTKYHEYFFSDILLNKYYNEVYSNEYKDENTNKLLILSPLYALYFSTLFYKRYLYYLSRELKNNRLKFSFISDSNINENSKGIFEGMELGEYIYKRVILFNSTLKRVINTAMNAPILEKKHEEYRTIFKGVFNIVYSMNLDNTTINQEWLDNNISKISTLEDLNKRMVLGKANLSQPTIEQINKLNEYIQTLEVIAGSLERDID